MLPHRVMLPWTVSVAAHFHTMREMMISPSACCLHYLRNFNRIKNAFYFHFSFPPTMQENISSEQAHTVLLITHEISIWIAPVTQEFRSTSIFPLNAVLVYFFRLWRIRQLLSSLYHTMKKLQIIKKLRHAAGKGQIPLNFGQRSGIVSLKRMEAHLLRTRLL